jgi:hypothetical protein
VARTALAAERTGVSFFRLLPGKRSPFTHRHTDAEEVYVILSGTGRVKLDDEVLGPQQQRLFQIDAFPVVALCQQPELEVLLAADQTSPSQRAVRVARSRTDTHPTAAP